MNLARMRRSSMVLLGVILAWLASLAQKPARTGNSTQPSADNSPIQVEMKNVMYHFRGPIAVHIMRLRGTLTPTTPGAIVVFEDKNSFTLNLSSAEIAIDYNSLARVLNENVFSAAEAPIKKVTIANRGNELLIKGELHKKGDVPFEATGRLTITGDGRIRFHAEKVKAAYLPVKGLLDLLGIDLAKLINTKKVTGLSADKDDLILNPHEILPPPHIRGKVTAVRLEGSDIVQVFGSAPSADSAIRQSGNYMAYREGNLRFGKITMYDTDLILLDMDPRDVLDFYLDHYKEQLVAGYTKMTPDLGLRVYLRDYGKLAHRTARQSH